MLNLLLAFCLFLSGASSSSHTSASLESGSALASSGKTDGPLSGLLIAVNDLNLSEENVEDNYLETASDSKTDKNIAKPSEDRIAHLNDLEEELGPDYNGSAPAGCGPMARRCGPVARRCQPMARRCAPAPMARRCTASAPVGCGPMARRCAPMTRQCQPMARRCAPAPMARRCTASAPVGCGPMARRCAPVVRQCQPMARRCAPAPMARRCTASAPVGCGPMARHCAPRRHMVRRCGPSIRSCGPIARVEEDEALSTRNVDIDPEMPAHRDPREVNTNTSGNLW